jgi:poly(hydroxyalkanoate) depolymerase family esterase
MVMNLIAWLIWLTIGMVMTLIMRFFGENRLRHWYETLVGILGAFIGGLLFNQFGFVGITDFHPWSVIGAAIGAPVLIIVYRILAHQDPVRIEVVKVKSTTVNPDVMLEGNTEPTERIGVVRPRLYRHRDFLVAMIMLIPFLDLAILRLKLPSISQMPPDFGVVESYSNEYGKLDYVVYTPAAYDGAEEIPLLLMLHGCTQTPQTIETASGMTQIADTNNFILVYPQQNANASPHRCWNWYQQQNQTRESGEPSLLVGIVNQVRESYAVDEGRIYVTGLSSGGAMTSILASCFPDVFASAAVHSGMAYKSANSVVQAIIAPFRGNQTPPNLAGEAAYACSGTQGQTIPTLVMHGTVDSVVFPINADHALIEMAQLNDLQDDGQDNDSVRPEPTHVQSQQVEGGHAYTIEDYVYDGELLLQTYRVENMGHTWAGGTGTFPQSDPQAPNASQIFWDFMSAYRLAE